MLFLIQFGIKVVKGDGYTYHIPLGVYTNPEVYCIEGDASSATYPLAYAALTQSTVTVDNIGSASMQGDAAFSVEVLQRMGCIVEQTPTTTTVTGQVLKGLGRIDMTSMTDAFLTATVLAAHAEGTSEITGFV